MKVCIWSDGTWCEFSELGQMTHMSDDFITRAVPDECEDVEAWIDSIAIYS